MRKPPKPVQITMGFTSRIYAVRSYDQRGTNERGEPLFVARTGGKDDVTDQAIAAVKEHIRQCETEGCLCKRLFQADKADTPGETEA